MCLCVCLQSCLYLAYICIQMADIYDFILVALPWLWLKRQRSVLYLARSHILIRHTCSLARSLASEAYQLKWQSQSWGLGEAIARGDLNQINRPLYSSKAASSSLIQTHQAAKGKKGRLSGRMSTNQGPNEWAWQRLMTCTRACSIDLNGGHQLDRQIITTTSE